MPIALTLSFVVALSACGARSALEVEGDDGAPMPIECGAPAGGCAMIGPPIELGRGQSPDVAFDGERAIVVHDVLPPGEVRVVVVERDGAIVADEQVHAEWPAHDARLAWHPRFGTGLVTSTSALRWLDSDARPTGEVVLLGPAHYASPFPIADGFLVIAGGNGSGSEAPRELRAIRAPPEPGPLVTEVWAPDGPRGHAEAALDDEGLARTLVSCATWGDGRIDLVRLDARGAPSSSLIIEPSMPPHSMFGDGGTAAIADLDGISWIAMIRGDGSRELARVTGDEVSRAPLPWLIGYPQLARAGARLYLAHEVHDETDTHRARVTALDPECPSAPGRTLELDERMSHSTRLARTPEGFVVVWNALVGDIERGGHLATNLAWLRCETE